MKFADAHAKLRAIAAGRYCSISYELTTFSDGELKSRCGVYLDGYKWYHANTWDAAFHELNKALHPEQFIEEMPEVEG